MLVSINALASGTCVWCCQPTDEAVEVAFHDGLKGCLCKRHFWEALKARAARQPESDNRTPAVPSSSREKQM